MSDGHGNDHYGGDGYGWDAYGGQQRILGYDEYGRPVYAQDQTQAGAGADAVRDYGYAPPQGGYAPQDGYAAPHDGYAAPHDGYAPSHDGYAAPYDPYGTQTGPQPAVTDPYAGRSGSAHEQAAQQYAAGQYPAAGPYTDDSRTTGPYPGAYEGYDPYGPAADTGAGPAATGGAGPVAGTAPPDHGTGTLPAQPPPPDEPARPAERARGHADGHEEEYDTGEFAFVEEGAEDSEDVIDWLKFTESRTERREEAKRRGRNRKRALVVLLVLAVLGAVGYLWYAGKLPGLGAGPGIGTSTAGQQRDVLVVHLRSPDSEASSTALLVDNTTTRRGTTLLLPNSLAVTTSDGSTTTLGKSVEDEGATPTRDALNRLLGADIKGTWRLDTPYLEILVDTVGGVTLDADATVPGEEKGDDPLVRKGKARELDGRAAVAYATHRGHAEPKAAQLERFGQVMQAVLTEMSTNKTAATRTVESLGQILDPSISQGSLGASLASLAEVAQKGAHETTLLPVREDGTLSTETSEGLVKEVLGGTVRNSDPDAAPRVALRNAAGDEGADDAARVRLVNGGFTVVGAAQADGTREKSQVIYTDPKQKERAQSVAKTLGLPDDSVRKGDGASNADVTVFLGEDYDA